jgi:uncharacterized protein (TIGR02421 family)
MNSSTLATTDLRADRELAGIAEGFRFLLDLTPIDLVEAREDFESTQRPPRFRYRPLEDDPDLAMARLADVPVDSVEDPTIASLLLAKQRELQLKMEMLACRGSEDFLALSIEVYGAVSPALLREARDILSDVPPPGTRWERQLDAEEFAAAAQAELDRYRRTAPDLEAHVEIRDDTAGVMVSNGDLLVAPTTRVAESRVEALLHHEIGTHVVTHVNGANQPLHVLAVGLAGYEETQEGLAVLAEYLVGGLTSHRLRQLAARVVAVHEMVAGADFTEVHRQLVDAGIDGAQAFTITMRVFRSGGLTKDAVYLRGLHDLVTHVSAGQGLDVLWLGKMPISAAPLVEDLHRRGVLVDPLLLPRYLAEPGARVRLADIHRVASLAELIQGAP